MNGLPSSTPGQPDSSQENAWISDVLDQHGDRALALALRIVGQFRDAEDVLQESLLKLVQRARKRHIRNVPAYLNAVVKTTALDVLAKRKADRLSQTPVDECQLPDQTDPAKLIQTKELSARLEWAIGRLEPRLAKVVIGRDLNGQSYAEIAQDMGISQDTARNYRWQAIQELQRIFSGSNPFS